MGHSWRKSKPRFKSSTSKLFIALLIFVCSSLSRPESDASGSGVQPTWGNTNSTTPHDSNAATRSPPPRTDYQPYRGGHAAGGDYNTSTAMPQPAAYYDPNHSPQPQSAPLPFPSPNVDAKKSTQPTAVEGYDVTPIASQPIGESRIQILFIADWWSVLVFGSCAKFRSTIVISDGGCVSTSERPKSGQSH